MFEFMQIFQSAFQGHFSNDEVECAELKDLVNELQPVIEWFHLGLNLDIPPCNLLEIEHDYKTIKDCRIYMLTAWEKRERPTWSKVVRALTEIGRELLAQELATKYGTAVPITQSDNTVPLPAVPEPSGSEIAGYQPMMVPAVHVEANRCVDTDLKQIEKQLKSTEENLKECQASRGVVKQDIFQSIKSLQPLQTELRRVNKEINDIQVKLEQKKKKCEDLQRMKEHYKNMWRSSIEYVKLLEETIEEKEQEIMKLEADLEQKKAEFQTQKQKLFQVQEHLFIQTKELEKKTSQVLELEKEVEQLTNKLTNRGKELDMEIQQLTAKMISQDTYIGEIKFHLSSMTGELSTKEEQLVTYKNIISGKEKKITKLSQTLDSRNVQMNELKEQLKAKVAAARDRSSSTAENLTTADELVTVMIHVSKLSVELDEAKRERYQMMLKRDSACQEANRLQQSIKEIKTMIPDPNKCRAVGVGLESAEKHQISKFTVEVVDTDGNPCTGSHSITVELKSKVDESVTFGSVVSKTPAIHEITYQPSRSGEHEISVKVNDMEINDSPFALLVHNIPHPQKCKAIGEGIVKAEKCKTSKFIVQLSDADGDPCVIKQEVIVELKSLVDASITKGHVVSKTAATYEVSYQPSRSGEHELSVKVNAEEINDSPFALLIVNTPDPQNCKALGNGIIIAKKNRESEFTVQLADAEGDPCLTEQEVIADLKSKVDGSCTKVNVVSKTPATYEATYQPNMAGEHVLSVEVNGEAIQSSPFMVNVVWNPVLVRVINGLHNPRGIAMGSDGMIVVIEEGGLSLLSKDGQRIKTIGSDLPRPMCTAAAVDGTGNIYTLSSGRVYKLIYDGEVKAVSAELKCSGFGIAASHNSDIAICKGKVFFAGAELKTGPNTISKEILVFNTDLKRITSFTIFNSNSKLACDSAGNLCAISATEVNVFSPNGTLLRTITYKKVPIVLTLRTLLHRVKHVDCNTYIYVIYSSFKTLVFDKAGTFITSLRHSYSPCGITTDEDGFMYICNSEKGCIEVFH